MISLHSFPQLLKVSLLFTHQPLSNLLLTPFTAECIVRPPSWGHYGPCRLFLPRFWHSTLAALKLTPTNHVFNPQISEYKQNFYAKENWPCIKFNDDDSLGFYYNTEDKQINCTDMNSMKNKCVIKTKLIDYF